MKTIKSLSSLLFMAVMAILIVSVTGWNVFAVAGGLVLCSFIPAPKGVALMAVTKETWIADIVDLLFPNDSFANLAVDHTPFVIDGKVAHVPKAGAAQSVVRNRSSFPATVQTRTDTDLTYNLEPYSTDPVKIANIDKYELAYDKRQSVLGAEMRNLVSKCMTGLLYNWAPTANSTYVHRTSGAQTDANLSGATGYRKSFHKSDLDVVKMAMDENDIDINGRVALLNARHYNELILSFDTNELTNFHQLADKARGVIGQYNGFEIRMRSFVLRYLGSDDSEAKVDTLDSGYAATANDRKGSLIWQRDAVAKAVGQTDMFESINDPLYYGDVYSLEQRMGGRTIRTEGVHAIVDAIVV